MRKERRLLKHVADVAILHGDIDAALRVEEDAVADRDASLVWPGQSGDAAEQRGLSRTRRAEEHRDAGRRVERDIEREAGPEPLRSR